jgi:hypothetical protein
MLPASSPPQIAAMGMPTEAIWYGRKCPSALGSM